MPILGDFGSAASIIGTSIAIGGGISYIFHQHKLRSLEKKYKNLAPDQDSYEVLTNVGAVKNKISYLIKNRGNEFREITIDNMGLDLETIMNLFNYDLKHKKINYRALIINYRNQKISKYFNEKEFINGSISLVAAKRNSEGIKNHQNDMSFKGFEPEMKIKLVSYRNLPVMHGFLLDDTHLFIGLTHFKNGKLFGGNKSYLYLKRDKKLHFNNAIFLSYQSWFEHLWENGYKETEH